MSGDSSIGCLMHSLSTKLHTLGDFDSDSDSTTVDIWLGGEGPTPEETAAEISFSKIVIPYKDAKAASITDRVERGERYVPKFTYGVMEFPSICRILRYIMEHCKPMSSELTFIDLGSGAGNTVYSAALQPWIQFNRCIGIELMPTLHKLAESCHQRYISEVKGKKIPTTIEFYQADISSVKSPSNSEIKPRKYFNWSIGDIIFANSTCFDGNLMEKISVCGKLLQSGAIFITNTKPLLSDCFELILKQKYHQSWGQSSVHIYRRK